MMRVSKKMIERVHTLLLLTSGQCLIFDKDEKQIAGLQKHFTEGQTNTELLTKIANKAESFIICKFREWNHRLDKEEFFKLTNLKLDE